MSVMCRSRLARLSLALPLVVAGLAAGAAPARAETAEEMARDLIPSQKSIYELGGGTAESEMVVEAWVDRPERIYAVGQQLRVFVRPKQTSYITVLNVGTSGRVAVIFPNFHQRDMQVRAGQTLKIPADGAGWKIDVAGPPGIEVVKVIASREPLNLPEILKVAGATAEQPIFSLGRTSEDVARDLVPQVNPPGGGATVPSGGVKNLLVRVVQRGAGATVPGFGSTHLSGAFGIRLRPERPIYKIGETVSIAVGVEKDCNLTLIGVGRSGQPVRLFPNGFQIDGFVRAGQTVVVPSPRAPVQLKAEAPAGVEGLLATCRSSADPAGLTRDLVVAPVADGQVEQVSGSFLVVN
jgi:hypothetical protein